MVKNSEAVADCAAQPYHAVVTGSLPLSGPQQAREQQQDEANADGLNEGSRQQAYPQYRP